jgi:cyclohexyl-isocyanide hydratase
MKARAEPRVGIILFPHMTQLDVTGPYEVFARMPAINVHLVAATHDAVHCGHGLRIAPDLTFDTAPALDVICVPGGIGVNAAMEDQTLLEFLRRQAGGARYITSVCTGALVLGAAGLLQGYRATTHWLSLELLTIFGARPMDRRVVIDRNRITAGGVTAGIDFGLVMAAELCGTAAATEIQLMIEYDPTPSDGAGPRSVPADILARARRTRQPLHSERCSIARRAARRLNHATLGNNGTARSLDPETAECGSYDAESRGTRGDN